MITLRGALVAGEEDMWHLVGEHSLSAHPPSYTHPTPTESSSASHSCQRCCASAARKHHYPIYSDFTMNTTVKAWGKCALSYSQTQSREELG